jgi:hypothetical protein
MPVANPALNPGGGAEPELDTFADPVLEAFAMQNECRWQVALATLWKNDPGLCQRVKRRLAAVVNFGDAVAPVWPVNQADLEALLGDLVSSRLNPSQQADRAEAWLNSQPDATAWVIDDAGQRDATTGQTVATCGVCNLSEKDTLGWTIAGKIPGSPELSRVKGFSAASLVATAVPPEEDSNVGVTRRRAPTSTDLEIHLGRWSVTKAATLDRVPARPPGVRIEPLCREWDLRTWLEGGIPAPMEDNWTAAGRLYLDPARSSEPREGWMLFIECRSPAIGTEETVRVWLGAFGAPASVIKIGSAGTAIDELGPKQGIEGPLRGTSITRQGDVWSARVPIPARCIEQDGTIRIGVERTDGLGRRTSWPRSMLPWQTEPGRIAVDTGAWGTVSAAEANKGGK